MKDFFKSFFASLLAIIVSGVIFFVVVVASISKSVTDKEVKKSDGSVLVIDLEKSIHEQGQSNSLAILSHGSGYESGLYDITKALNHAKSDPAIKGILIKLAPSPNGWATMQQLRMAIIDFKTSHKFVYAYGEDISQGAYFAATAADSIYLNPAGNLELKGFATVMAYFKGMLDKLELQPEIFYAGKFKSATEPFRADKISEPNRLQIQAFQGGLWGQFLQAAAGFAQTDSAHINALAVSGAVQFPGDALKYKLVTGLKYWDEVEARIRAKTGQDDKDDVKYMSINDYTKDGGARDMKYSEDKIAVLMAEGEIVDGEQKNDNEIASKTMCDEIRKLRLDDHVKAVVLRVNSPGGSALASEVILRELKLLKEKKHLIVSMGDYAASGGYYISSGADSIFALPNTITGSIGVFSMMFSIDKLMKNKLGITFDEVKNAPYADLPTTSRPLTPEEGQIMQNSVDTIYALFKRHVSEGRRLNPADVDSIAQGRVWTGSDALGIGLVDGMGGIDRAIACAAGMAKLKDYRVATYPEASDKLNSLLRKFGISTSADEAMKAALKEELGGGYEWYDKLKSLSRTNGKAMMAMPYVLTVK